jgi:type IV secretory pathway TrbD component
VSTQPPPGHHHRVYKAMIRPLTLMGVERRLFFLALLLGAAAFNLFYSLLAGILIFAIVYGIARVCATVDPQMIPIALQSVARRSRYDAARHDFGATPR